MAFWSSVVLTGNRTAPSIVILYTLFWSSVVLTGNRTYAHSLNDLEGFGAVSF